MAVDIFCHGRACPGHPRLNGWRYLKDVDARHKACARAGRRPDPCAGHDGDPLLNLQVGYSRLAMFETRSFAALLSMRPRELAQRVGRGRRSVNSPFRRM